MPVMSGFPEIRHMLDESAGEGQDASEVQYHLDVGRTRLGVPAACCTSKMPANVRRCDRESEATVAVHLAGHVNNCDGTLP
jgi:hypothetical protein